jgi:hypothetical protein
LMGCSGKQARSAHVSDSEPPAATGAHIPRRVQAPPRPPLGAPEATASRDGHWKDQPWHDEIPRCREMLQIAGRANSTVDDTNRAMARTALSGCRGPSERGCRTCCQQNSRQCIQRQSSRPIDGVGAEADFYNVSVGIGARCPADCRLCAACGLREETRARGAIEELVSCKCELTPDPIDPCWGGGCDCAWSEIKSELSRQCPHLFGGWQPSRKETRDP